VTSHTLDPETDVDLDGPSYAPPTSTPVFDAEVDGDWDNTPTSHAAVPTPGKQPAGPKPTKAEVVAEYDARGEQTRAGRRRRRLTGFAITTLIFASAAASVVGWPVVLAGLAAAGGAGTVGYAATKGARNANGNGRGNGRGNGTGRGNGNGNGRGNLGGGGPGRRGILGRLGGGAGGGRRGGGLGGGTGRRAGGAGSTGSLNPFKGALGRKAAAQKATAAKKTAAAGSAAGGRTATSGARSGPPAGRKATAGTGRATGKRGLFGGGKAGKGGLFGGGRGGATPRRTANGRRTPTNRPVPHHGRGSSSGRTPRTASGVARKAKQAAVRAAKQRQATQRGQHNATARTRRATQRFARRQQRVQQRWTMADQRRQARQHTRDAARAARNIRRTGRQQARRTKRQQATAQSRAFYRRHLLVAASKARRNLVRRPAGFIARNMRRAAAAGWQRVSPLVALGRRAQLLTRLRQLNPNLGTRQQRRFRAVFGQLIGRLTGFARTSWDASLGRMFAGINRMLRNAAAHRNVNLDQLWRDFYTYLAQHQPFRGRHRTTPAPTPTRAAPAPPFRGMNPAQRAAVAATLGMGSGSTRSGTPTHPTTATRRPVRPNPRPVQHGPSTRTPRPTMAVPTRQAMRTPRGTKIPMAGNAAAPDATEVRHPAFEAALSAMQENVGGYEIPDDGTGVLDVDAFIASIGGFMQGAAQVLEDVASYLSEGPTNQVVCEQLNEFSEAIRAMGTDAGEVYETWRTNEDNAHDLRRAEGEINQAALFNVQ
jgi:hypothetical protein